MAPVARSLVKRASLGPLSPASLALIIVGSLLVVSLGAAGFLYYRKRRAAPSPEQAQPKPGDRSSSSASEGVQLEQFPTGAPDTNTNNNTGIVGKKNDSQNYRYSVGMMSRMSHGGSARSPRMPRSPAANRYSMGMLSRTSIDPSVSSPNPDRNRSRSRSRVEKDRAYARMSMGVMSRASMGPRSPGVRSPRSPRTPQDPLLSAGIMSRASMGPAGLFPRIGSAAPSPAIRQEGGFIEPPPKYS